MHLNWVKGPFFKNMAAYIEWIELSVFIFYVMGVTLIFV